MLINIFPGWILESDMNKRTIADCLWPYPFFNVLDGWFVINDRMALRITERGGLFPNKLYKMVENEADDFIKWSKVIIVLVQNLAMSV